MHHTAWTILRDFGLTIASGVILIFLLFGLIDAWAKLRKAMRLHSLKQETRKERRAPEVVNDQLWTGKRALDRAVAHQKQQTLANLHVKPEDAPTGAQPVLGDAPTAPGGFRLDEDAHARAEHFGLRELLDERGA